MEVTPSHLAMVKVLTSGTKIGNGGLVHFRQGEWNAQVVCDRVQNLFTFIHGKLTIFVFIWVCVNAVPNFTARRIVHKFKIGYDKCDQIGRSQRSRFELGGHRAIRTIE